MSDLILKKEQQTDMAAVNASGIGGGYLPYLSLCTFMSQLVKDGAVVAGNFAVGDTASTTTLGENITPLFLAARAKATDYGNKDSIVVNHDPASEEYQRISAKANLAGRTNATYGPEFLMWLPNVGFFTYHMGSKSARRSAKPILTICEKDGSFEPSWIVMSIEKKTNSGGDEYHVSNCKRFEGETPEMDFTQEEFDKVYDEFINPKVFSKEDQAEEEDAG